MAANILSSTASVWRRYSLSNAAASGGSAQSGPTRKPAKSRPLLNTASSGLTRLIWQDIDAMISRPMIPGS